MAAPKMAANSNNNAHRRRRLTADRTQYNQRPTTRNVRTSSMPGNPTNQTGGSRDTIDEEFAASYEQAGIQPQELGGDSEESRQKYQQPKQIDRSARVDYRNQQKRSVSQTVSKKTKGSKLKKGKKVLRKGRAVTATIGIWVWAWPSYLFFQLPIAILGLVLFSLAAGLSGLIEGNEEDGYISSAIKGGIGLFFSLGDAIFELLDKLGVHIGFDPTQFFLIPYLIVFLFGLLVLFIIYFIYKISFLNPLSGDAAGMKLGVLLLAMIGYGIPILNLFPWFFIWTLVVLKNPK